MPGYHLLSFDCICFSAEMVPVGEVSNLRQKVAIMEKEFCNNAIRLNASDNLKKSHEDKIKRLEDHVNIIASSKV